MIEDFAPAFLELRHPTLFRYHFDATIFPVPSLSLSEVWDIPLDVIPSDPEQGYEAECLLLIITAELAGPELDVTQLIRRVGPSVCTHQ